MCVILYNNVTSRNVAHTYRNVAHTYRKSCTHISKKLHTHIEISHTHIQIMEYCNVLHAIVYYNRFTCFLHFRHRDFMRDCPSGVLQKEVTAISTYSLQSHNIYTLKSIHLGRFVMTSSQSIEFSRGGDLSSSFYPSCAMFCIFRNEIEREFRNIFCFALFYK